MQVALGVEVLHDPLVEADAWPLRASLSGRLENRAAAYVLDLHAHLGAAAADLLVLVGHHLHDLAVELHHRAALQVTRRNHCSLPPASTECCVLGTEFRTSSFGEWHRTRAPRSSRTTRSSIRTPPQPGR